ncbi:MAG: serine protease [Chloroflexi bacterium]|jgi:hypothetical protein|nr:serine protease [Chloroflexota bacterium]
MALTGRQWGKLSDALNEAFPGYNFMQRLLRREMDLALQNIAAQGPMPDVLYSVIEYTEATNRTLELVEAARRNRPNDPELFAIAQELGLAPATGNLERMLSTSNIVFDVSSFRKRMATVEGQVCLVEIKGQNEGTGFLVGPNSVLTNYHVVQKIIEKKPGYTPGDVKLRFDYKRLDDGVTINSGTLYQVVDDWATWLVDSSRYSDVDTLPEPKPSDPDADQLDYAVLRLKEKAAEENLGKVPGMDSTRGFMDLATVDTSYDFSENKVIFIVQHPLGMPLKVTVNTFRNFNGNSTRLTYLNDTEPGSSGSPVFNGNWNLVALHHSGDPTFGQPAYNEGIPMEKIVSRLQQNGKLAQLMQ